MPPTGACSNCPGPAATAMLQRVPSCSGGRIPTRVCESSHLTRTPSWCLCVCVLMLGARRPSHITSHTQCIDCCACRPCVCSFSDWGIRLAFGTSYAPLPALPACSLRRPAGSSRMQAQRVGGHSKPSRDDGLEVTGAFISLYCSRHQSSLHCCSALQAHQAAQFVCFASACLLMIRWRLLDVAWLWHVWASAAVYQD